MSHRVAKFQAVATSKTKAEGLKSEINSKLDSKGYDLFDRSVSDGENMKGQATVGFSLEFNKSSECDSFGNWIKSWMETNKASASEDGSIDSPGFVSVEYFPHDCYHNVEGMDRPCGKPDYTSFDVRNRFNEDSLEV